jgi:hypothetical protein
MRVQAPNYAHDGFILGKNSHRQPVGNTREKQWKVCGIGACADVSSGVEPVPTSVPGN